MIEVHEAAEIFPLDEESIPELAEDIRANGQLVAIERLDGKVIDGRRRLKACELVGVRPTFRDVTVADPVGYVLSLNLHRRHLTTAQRSMVGGRARDLYDRQAKERQKASGKVHGRAKEKVPVILPEPKTGNGDARELVGRAVNVSGKSIDMATKVLKNGVPELVKAVDDGRLRIYPAARIAELPAEDQRRELDKEKGPRPSTTAEPAPEPETEAGHTSRGKGIQVAHEAINLLAQIPKNDQLRKRGFEIVMEWVRRNLRKM